MPIFPTKIIINKKNMAATTKNLPFKKQYTKKIIHTMDHSKHKMPSGKMMLDKEMKKMMDEKNENKKKVMKEMSKKYKK